MRVLSDRDVERLLTMERCVEVMAGVLAATAGEGVVNPLRAMLRFPAGNGVLGWMPAYLDPPRATGIKVVTVMPGNHGTPFDSHQGAVLLFEAEHGALLAVIDGSSVTAIRTAAVSAVATRALAREDARCLALIGSGVQARTHLEAMLLVRPLERITVWSRDRARAEAFAAREGARWNRPVEVAASAREAVAGADIVCTTTGAVEPVVCGDWISAGAHLNAVGACFASARELDTAAVARSRLFVDRRESALHEAGDLLLPMAEGALTEAHIVGELGEVLTGTVPGRRSPEEVTLFKSLGIGAEDVAAAQFLVGEAEARNAGVEVDLGGRRA